MNKYRFEGPLCYIEIVSPKHGKFEAIIDTDDYNRVKVFNWSIQKRNTKLPSYDAKAAIFCGVAKKVYTITLHRLITSFEYGMVDHINRDALDNRKINLRETNPTMNAANVSVIDRGLYRGVYMENGKYKVVIRKAKKEYYGGHFSTLLEASEASKSLYIKHYGQLFD
jgi:hypothetical protein